MVLSVNEVEPISLNLKTARGSDARVRTARDGEMSLGRRGGGRRREKVCCQIWEHVAIGKQSVP